ncbi:MAG: L-fucose:H+ symporter permease [Terracidiphilus sp.]
MHLSPLADDPGQSRSQSLIPRQAKLAFFLVTGLFFLWAIPNNLNDVLIRQFMKSFEITRLQAGLVQSAFYLGYFVFSIPAALVMRRFGYKTGLVSGLILYSAGTFLFFPAASARSYPLFLMALFVIASGLGFLETGANPLIAQLGESESSVRRLNFSQAFNPIGSICGAMIGTLFIFSGVEPHAREIAQMKSQGMYDAYLQHETARVLAPYMVLGVIVLVWAFLILKTQFPAVAGGQSSSAATRDGGYIRLLQYPSFLFAVVAQFCYVGAQVGTWSYFIQYVQDYTHVSEKTAGFLLTATLAAFAIGRFASSYLMKRINPERMLGFFALTNILLLTLGVSWPGWTGMMAILLTSFFMSLMFPTIFALGIKDLGAHTKEGASLIVMSIIGGAVFTPLMGIVFQFTKSMARSMCIPLLCYMVVATYAFWGCRLIASPNSAPNRGSM